MSLPKEGPTSQNKVSFQIHENQIQFTAIAISCFFVSVRESKVVCVCVFYGKFEGFCVCVCVG